MYRIDRNNYHSKPKNFNIYTPPEVSQFIFDLLRNWVEPLHELILDPCCGKGSLLEPWRKIWDGLAYPTVGIDIDPNSSADWKTDFLSLTDDDFYRKFKEPALVLCNPPFNGMKPQLAPEIWLDQIIKLFGKDIPLVLFAPVGLRICNDLKSKRWNKWTNGTYPSISSIISLPRTIFPQIEFHAEILIFNIPNLQSHYFYHEKQSFVGDQI